jgi:hypothetical protein
LQSATGNNSFYESKIYERTKDWIYKQTYPVGGSFTGVGITPDIVKDTLVIKSVFAKSPAEKVGLLPEDRIVKINGENIANNGITIEKASSLLRGEKGTDVTVTIQRNKTIKDYTITRDRILNDDGLDSGFDSYENVSKYDIAQDVAGAQKNGKWGVIDRIGRVVISFEYDTVFTFSYRLVCAKKDGKWGLVDFNNNILLPFTKIDPKSVGKSSKSSEKKVDENGIQGIYNEKKKQIETAKIEAYIALNNRILYAEEKKAEEERIAEAKRDAKRPTPHKVNNLWGFAEKGNGNKIIILPSYNEYVELKNYFLVSKNGLWGFVDKEVGKELVPPQYGEYIKIGNRLLVQKNNLYGLISDDPTKPVLDCKYEIYPFDDNYFISENKKYGLIDKSGYISLFCKYDNIIFAEDVSSAANTYFYLLKNDKWGWGSVEKGELCECKYDVIGEFKNGEAVVYYKGYEGKINTSGKETQSVVRNLFNTAYNMNTKTQYQEELRLYNEVLALDKEYNEGWSGVCYNNIGLIYEDIFGDRQNALSYYSASSSAGNDAGTKNYKRLKSQIKAEQWQAVANALQQTADAIGSYQNQTGSNYNYNNNSNYSGSSGGSGSSSDCSSYQRRYNEMKAKRDKEANGNAGREGTAAGKNALHRVDSQRFDAATGGDYRVINSTKSLIREYEQQMQSIANQARQAGCSVY